MFLIRDSLKSLHSGPLKQSESTFTWVVNHYRRVSQKYIYNEHWHPKAGGNFMFWPLVKLGSDHARKQRLFFFISSTGTRKPYREDTLWQEVNFPYPLAPVQNGRLGC